MADVDLCNIASDHCYGSLINRSQGIDLSVDKVRSGQSIQLYELSWFAPSELSTSSVSRYEAEGLDFRRQSGKEGNQREKPTITECPPHRSRDL